MLGPHFGADMNAIAAAKDPERAEDAVKYIIFLSDANKLFDLALGMYDFPLVLMIAQQSQKVRLSSRRFKRRARELWLISPSLRSDRIRASICRS